MENNIKYDFIVLGGGSGGISAAKKAASYGKKCAIIEKSFIGGTCINLGCVPKKIMYNASLLAESFEHRKYFHFIDTQSENKIDWAALKATRDKYLRKLNSLYLNSLKSSNIDLIEGTGIFLSKNQISVNEKVYEAEHILIATGSKPDLPEIKGKQLAIISDGFFELEKQPKKVAVIGSGYIAVELANIFKDLRSEVDIFIRKQTLLTKFDCDIQTIFTKMQIEKGITIHKNSVVCELSGQAQNVSILTEDGNTFEEFDCVIYAIGRTANIESLNQEKIQLNLTSDGFIQVNEYSETNIESIYAVGDVTGQAMLTPVAIACSRRLIDRIFGNQKNVKTCLDLIPTVVFSHPPVATIGLTQEQSINKYGIDKIALYVSNFTNLFYALFPEDKKQKTYFKLIVLLPEEKVIGLHAIGMGSDELLQGFAVAIQLGVTKEQLDQTIAIHPTAAEEFVTMKNRIVLGDISKN